MYQATVQVVDAEEARQDVEARNMGFEYVRPQYPESEVRVTSVDRAQLHELLVYWLGETYATDYETDIVELCGVCDRFPMNYEFDGLPVCRHCVEDII